MRKILLSIYEYWLNWRLSAKITSALLNVTLCSIAALVISYYIINANKEVEQVGSQWTELGEQILLRNAEKVSQEVRVLETLAKTPSLIEAVKAANVERADWSPEAIVRQDEAWMANDPTIEATVHAIAGNPVSDYLIDFQQSNPQEAEVFVTDRKGLNVAMTNRTSDFFQADEDWWKSTFGEGTVYFGAVEYDESSNVHAMDIGLPIRDPDSKEVIGVLRGTVDISALFNSLMDVEADISGHIILVNEEGIVLYSDSPSFFMQPVPESMQTLLASGKRGWAKSSDLDEDSAIVTYGSLDGKLGDSLGWRILVTQRWSEVTQSVIQTLLLSLLISVLVTITAIYLSGIIIRHSIITPIERMTTIAQELSVGNIIDHRDTEKSALDQRKDEVGEISRAFDRLTKYFQAAAGAATSIANRDLSINVTPNSDKDDLGRAFAKMVLELNTVMKEFAASAETVSMAATQLADASEQSGKATNQIATTIQQVAAGTMQQGEDVGRTASAVEQMNCVIGDVANGAQEQSTAIVHAVQLTSRISQALEQIGNNATSGARGAAEAAEAARVGADTVESTIVGMQVIKNKVGLSAEKVREMGQRSEQIDIIVETIDDIASQTNLLALNAAIEAARVEAKGEKTVESLLQQHMLGTINLIVDNLAAGHEFNSNDLVALARRAQVEDICISDPDGVITASNNPGSVGFRFSDNPHQESFVFRSLLNKKDGVVVRPIKVRDQDGKPYIYVGVSRKDRPGIVQAGTSADLVYRLGGYSRGFAVVADEVGKLAEHAKAATKEIAALVRTIQKTVTEAVVFMEDGARQVESGSAQTLQAGESLATILKAAEMVKVQVQEIASAIQHMNASSTELVHVMGTVGSVVEQNTAATKEMAINSSKLTETVENIASISEQNSAAVEEVSASTEEVLGQVEQVSDSAASLKKMASGLLQVIAQFSLTRST